MIPRSIDIVFNLRFSNELTQKNIKEKFEEKLSNLDCQSEVKWNCSAEPFITSEGKLTKILQKVIKEIVSVDSSLSTSGGTSDARFISKHANETVEFGPLNETAHKVNENINLKNLEDLEKIYYAVLCELLI
jgi:succinyl-diaminopimelate desuccinylase